MNQEFQGMDTAAIRAQRAGEINRQASKQSEFVFNPAKYLNTRLANGEMEKTIRIRLLPFSQTEPTPFHKVHTHYAKVNTEIAPSGYKRFICPSKNSPDIAKSPCPYCEVAEEAKAKRANAKSETERKAFDDVVMNHRSKECWIVRCIERGHEEDGVKFWMFSNAKDGVFNDLLTLDERRSESARRDGEQNYSIFSLNNGKDLELTIKRDRQNKTIISIVDAEKRTPLTENFELGCSWINDPTPWYEMFRVKPYDFMSIAMNGDVPQWDKENSKFIGKKEKEAIEEAKKQDAESRIVEEPTEFAVTPEEYNGNGEKTTNQFPQMKPQTREELFEDDEDDLPF